MPQYAPVVSVMETLTIPYAVTADYESAGHQFNYATPTDSVTIWNISQQSMFVRLANSNWREVKGGQSKLINADISSVALMVKCGRDAPVIACRMDIVGKPAGAVVRATVTTAVASGGGGTGPEGPPGPQGEKGDEGDIGPMGPSGAQGVAGVAGQAGATGPQGPQGVTGGIGPQGPQGLTGTTGTPGIGIQGPPGEIGPQGDPGPPGPPGSQGLQGPAGGIGPAGPQGPSGAAGAVGEVGPAGPQGAQGASGAVGSEGPIGLTGPAGAQGIQGLPGSAGAQGQQGIQGIQGPAGSIGPQGPAGGGLRVSLASDVVNANAVANTIADVTGLSFPVAAGIRYKFRFFITYTSAATTTGSRWAINGPTITDAAYRSEYTLSAAARTFNEGLSAYNLPAACNASSIVATNVAVIEGVIRCSAPGSVIARFASEITASAITAKAGRSFVEYEAIA